MSLLYGSVEAGGTKFVCGLGDAAGGAVAATTFPTRDPASTVAEMLAFFREVQAQHGEAAAFGVASFGPLRLDPGYPDHGAIVATPKPDWAGVNLRRALADAFGRPVEIDSDVNAAAWAEARAAGIERRALAYVTAGTGVGVGLANLAAPGLPHGELGHLRVRRHPGHEGFAGACPFHGDCLEGLASGPALKAFWGVAGQDLPDDHPAWEMQAFYIGELCAALSLAVRPARIVVGGGAAGRPGLLDGVRRETWRALGGYVEDMTELSAVDALIAAPSLSPSAGLIGGFLLAERAAATR